MHYKKSPTEYFNPINTLKTWTKHEYNLLYHALIINIPISFYQS